MHKPLQFIKKYYGTIIVLLITIFAMLPLFHSGFYPMHDDEQVGRLYDLDLDVKAGHLPPRLAQNLGYGYDYPLFNFYPSFIYYVAEIFHLSGFSYIVSIKLMIALGFILAAVWMYALAKEYFGRMAGVVSAFLYTYASYHSIDAYVRGALPEFWSFVFIPAIFWSYTKLSQKINVSWTIVTGILVACFVLTHDLLAMMSAPFIFAFLVYLVVTLKQKKRFVIAVIFSGLIGMGLSAYFWLPAIFEKKYTMVSLLTKELADYAMHFVYPVQFWFSPWGYGGSVAGTGDGLSFQIGKIYLLSLLFVLIYAVLLLRKSQKKAMLLFLLIGLFGFSLFMQISSSKFIWDTLQPVMAYIQFPWRFLVYSFFTASFAAGALFMYPFPLFKKQYVLYIQCAFAAFIMLLVIRTSFTTFQPSSYLTNVTDVDYISHDVIRWKTSNMSFEYVPDGIVTTTSARGNTVVAITHSQIAQQPFSSISGDMDIKVSKDIPQQKEALINVKRNGVLQINVYAFPGWRVQVDGKDIAFSDKNPLKLLRISLTDGPHAVSAVFMDTPVRNIGNVLSLVTIVLIILTNVYYKFNKKKKKTKKH